MCICQGWMSSLALRLINFKKLIMWICLIWSYAHRHEESQKNGLPHRPSFFYHFTSVTSLDSLKSQTNTHLQEKHSTPPPHFYGGFSMWCTSKTIKTAEINDSNDKTMSLYQLWLGFPTVLVNSLTDFYPLFCLLIHLVRGRGPTIAGPHLHGSVVICTGRLFRMPPLYIHSGSSPEGCMCLCAQ